MLFGMWPQASFLLKWLFPLPPATPSNALFHFLGSTYVRHLFPSSYFHIILFRQPAWLRGAFNNSEQSLGLREVFCCVICQLRFSVVIQRVCNYYIHTGAALMEQPTAGDKNTELTVDHSTLRLLLIACIVRAWLSHEVDSHLGLGLGILESQSSSFESWESRLSEWIRN